MFTSKRKLFPFYHQHDAMDCGPACLRMIASYHGRQYSLQDLRNRSYIDKEGVSLQGISEAAESIGYRTMGVKIPYSDKADRPSLSVAPLPVISHWNQNHFVVVYRISKKYVWIADPSSERHKLKVEDFKKHWISDYDLGITLLLEPTAKFADNEIGGVKMSVPLPFSGLILSPIES